MRSADRPPPARSRNRPRLLATAAALLAAAACSNVPNPPQPGLPAPPAPPNHYSVSVLPVPPEFTDARANDINDAGVIAGWAKTATPPGAMLSLRAVRWQNGAMTDLGAPRITDYGDHTIEDVNSQANGISSTGVIVGTFSIERYDPLAFPSETTVDSAFRWTESNGFERLPGLGQGNTRAYAVNGAGVVVGEVRGDIGGSRAVRWSANGTIEALLPAAGSAADDINEEGWIAGQVVVGSNRHAYLWRPNGAGTDVMPSIAGVYSSHGLNLARVIVGIFWQGLPPWSFNPHQAVRWVTSSGLSTLVLPSCDPAAAFDVSDQGRMVGVCGPAPARAWTSHGGAFDLLPFPPKGTSAIAAAVNKCGTVVGEAFDGARKLAVQWSRTSCDP